jgi:hypothetical protein
MIPSWITRHIDESSRTKSLAYSKMHQHHIAFICKGRKVLSVAYNRVGDRSYGCGYNKRSIHAEANVIRSLGNVEKLRGAKLFVVRLTASGLMNSRPCSACQCIIQKCMKEYGLLDCIHS